MHICFESTLFRSLSIRRLFSPKRYAHRKLKNQWFPPKISMRTPRLAMEGTGQANVIVYR
jgi:hypothetical protein